MNEMALFITYPQLGGAHRWPCLQAGGSTNNKHAMWMRERSSACSQLVDDDDDVVLSLSPLTGRVAMASSSVVGRK